eukprot:tig00000880_g5200.t1
MWCHGCRSTVFLVTSVTHCPLCRGSFIEEVLPGTERDDSFVRQLPARHMGTMGSNRTADDDEEEDEEEEDEALRRNERDLYRRDPRAWRPQAHRFELQRHDPAPMSRGPATSLASQNMVNALEIYLNLVSFVRRAGHMVPGAFGGGFFGFIDDDTPAQPAQDPDDPYDHEVDNLLTHLMENDESSRKKAPTLKSVVQSLAKVRINEGHMRAESKCSVCREDWSLGDEAKELPCRHVFHDECIIPWLEQHNTCPLCRHELPVDEAQAEALRRQAALQPAPSPAGALLALALGARQTGRPPTLGRRLFQFNGAGAGAGAGLAEPAAVQAPRRDRDEAEVGAQSTLERIQNTLSSLRESRAAIQRQQEARQRRHDEALARLRASDPVSGARRAPLAALEGGDGSDESSDSDGGGRFDRGPRRRRPLLLLHLVFALRRRRRAPRLPRLLRRTLPPAESSPAVLSSASAASASLSGAATAVAPRRLFGTSASASAASTVPSPATQPAAVRRPPSAAPPAPPQGSAPSSSAAGAGAERATFSGSQGEFRPSSFRVQLFDGRDRSPPASPRAPAPALPSSSSAGRPPSASAARPYSPPEPASASFVRRSVAPPAAAPAAPQAGPSSAASASEAGAAGTAPKRGSSAAASGPADASAPGSRATNASGGGGGGSSLLATLMRRPSAGPTRASRSASVSSAGPSAASAAPAGAVASSSSPAAAAAGPSPTNLASSISSFSSRGVATFGRTRSSGVVAPSPVPSALPRRGLVGPRQRRRARCSAAGRLVVGGERLGERPRGRLASLFSSSSRNKPPGATAAGSSSGGGAAPRPGRRCRAALLVASAGASWRGVLPGTGPQAPASPPSLPARPWRALAVF